MANGYLELSDSKLLEWSQAFNDQIGNDPERFGLSSVDSAGYAELHDAYTAAMAENASARRNKITTEQKRVARAALLADARLLINKINGDKTVTDAQKIGLGVPVRASRTTAGVLESAPSIMIWQVQGAAVSVVLTHGVSGRGKMPGAIGATLFSHIGDAFPEHQHDWTFCGNFGRTSIDVVFPGGLPIGTKVWLSAQWMNSRLEPGAMAAPVSTHLQSGVVTMTVSGPRAGWALARAA